MIAALMASTDGSSDQSPTYVDLARVEASLERTVAADSFERLTQQCISLDPIQACLSFRFDEHKRVRVRVQVDGKCELSCQLCLEAQSWELNDHFDVVLARDEPQAQQWREGGMDRGLGVVVTDSAELDLVVLIEDEIMLSLPSQVCTDDSCSRRPQLDYGGDDVEKALQRKPNPFAELEKLKS